LYGVYRIADQPVSRPAGDTDGGNGVGIIGHGRYIEYGAGECPYIVCWCTACWLCISKGKLESFGGGRRRVRIIGHYKISIGRIRRDRRGKCRIDIRRPSCSVKSSGDLRGGAGEGIPRLIDK